MTINTIVCFFCFSTSWNCARCEGPCNPKFPHAKTHTTISDSVCKDLYYTQRTHHITIIIYLTQLNAGPEFRFGNFSLSQVFTLRKNYNAYKDTRQQCSNYTVDFGEPISFFFTMGGFCALAMGLQRYIKAMGGGGGGAIIYICRALWNPF